MGAKVGLAVGGGKAYAIPVNSIFTTVIVIFSLGFFYSRYNENKKNQGATWFWDK